MNYNPPQITVAFMRKANHCRNAERPPPPPLTAKRGENNPQWTTTIPSRCLVFQRCQADLPPGFAALGPIPENPYLLLEAAPRLLVSKAGDSNIANNPKRVLGKKKLRLYSVLYFCVSRMAKAKRKTFQYHKFGCNLVLLSQTPVVTCFKLGEQVRHNSCRQEGFSPIASPQRLPRPISGAVAIECHVSVIAILHNRTGPCHQPNVNVRKIPLNAKISWQNTGAGHSSRVERTWQQHTYNAYIRFERSSG